MGGVAVACAEQAVHSQRDGQQAQRAHPLFRDQTQPGRGEHADTTRGEAQALPGQDLRGPGDAGAAAGSKQQGEHHEGVHMGDGERGGRPTEDRPGPIS